MAITALKGNQIFSTKTLTRGGKTYETGQPLTINHVLWEPRANSNVVIVLEEMPGLMFDSGLDFLEDFVNIDEHAIINWCNGAIHPEALDFYDDV